MGRNWVYGLLQSVRMLDGYGNRLHRPGLPGLSGHADERRMPQAEKGWRRTCAAAPVAAPQLDSGKKAALLAAITAAIAEDMGTDVSAIRITSIKKV